MKTIRSSLRDAGAGGFVRALTANAAGCGRRRMAVCRQETKRVAVWPRTTSESSADGALRRSSGDGLRLPRQRRRRPMRNCKPRTAATDPLSITRGNKRMFTRSIARIVLAAPAFGLLGCASSHDADCTDWIPAMPRWSVRPASEIMGLRDRPRIRGVRRQSRRDHARLCRMRSLTAEADRSCSQQGLVRGSAEHAKCVVMFRRTARSFRSLRARDGRASRSRGTAVAVLSSA